MFERIVSPLVLRRTIIGSEAARVMPKSLERTATRISKIQEISSLFLVCNAIKVVFHTKYSHRVHKNMALGGSLPSVRLRFLEPGNYIVWKQSPSPVVSTCIAIGIEPTVVCEMLADGVFEVDFCVDAHLESPGEPYSSGLLMQHGATQVCDWSYPGLWLELPRFATHQCVSA